MPPIHCITLRHISMPCETSCEKSSNDAPVVVNPLMVSKNASVSVMWGLQIMNGTRPNNDRTTHVSPVSRIASRLRISRLRGRSLTSIPPAKSIMPQLMSS